MTPRQIIRMAEAAGLVTENYDAGFMNLFSAKLEAFAALVAAAEREECAKVCEKISDEYDENEGRKYAELRTDAATGGRDCASAIRSRGEKGQS